ncbi:hypothetical protein HHA02_08730 [Cobetia marina]|nr:hypothetical protein HHA02_08730 [Cobetia marina]
MAVREARGALGHLLYHWRGSSEIKLLQLGLDGGDVGDVGISPLLQQADLQDIELLAVLAEGMALGQCHFIGSAFD